MNFTSQKGVGTVVIIAVVVVILLLAGVGYMATRGGSQDTTTPVPQTQTETDTTNTTNTTNTTEPTGETESATGEVVEITIRNQGFRFVPNSITVNQGDTVRLTFENTGGTHNWTVDEFAGTQVLNEGESETIEFVADQVGEFEYYCSVGNHRQLGMVGTLIVQ